MDVKELESFVMSAQLRSGAKAARALGVGQPTITKHIHRLETELGRNLFARGQRPMQLTAAGAELLRLVAPLIEGIRDFTLRGKSPSGDEQLRIACTHGFMTELMLHAVKTFRELRPHQRLHIKAGTQPEVLDMVASGKVDFGIAPSPDNLNSLSFLPLAASERVLITPRNHALLRRPLRSLDEIAAYPLILMGYRTQTRNLLETRFRELGIAYEIAIELDSQDLVKRYIELGLGIGIGLRIVFDPADYQSLGMVSLSRFLPSEFVGISTLRQRVLSEPAQQFVSVITTMLKGAEAQRAGVLPPRARKAAGAGPER